MIAAAITLGSLMLSTISSWVLLISLPAQIFRQKVSCEPKYAERQILIYWQHPLSPKTAPEKIKSQNSRNQGKPVSILFIPKRHLYFSVSFKNFRMNYFSKFQNPVGNSRPLPVQHIVVYLKKLSVFLPRKVPCIRRYFYSFFVS